MTTIENRQIQLMQSIKVTQKNYEYGRMIEFSAGGQNLLWVVDDEVVEQYEFDMLDRIENAEDDGPPENQGPNVYWPNINDGTSYHARDGCQMRMFWTYSPIIMQLIADAKAAVDAKWEADFPGVSLYDN